MDGKTILANSGCTENSSAALRKIAAVWIANAIENFIDSKPAQSSARVTQRRKSRVLPAVSRSAEARRDPLGEALQYDADRLDVEYPHGSQDTPPASILGSSDPRILGGSDWRRGEVDWN